MTVKGLKTFLNLVKAYIKSYNEESDEGSFLEKLHELHNDLPFLPERMKIEKVEKLVANLHDETE